MFVIELGQFLQRIYDIYSTICFDFLLYLGSSPGGDIDVTMTSSLPTTDSPIDGHTAQTDKTSHTDQPDKETHRDQTDKAPHTALTDKAPPTTGGITIHRRTERYLFTRLLQTLIKPFKPRLASPGKIQPAESPRLTPGKKAKGSCHI